MILPSNSPSCVTVFFAISSGGVAPISQAKWATASGPIPSPIGTPSANALRDSK